MSKNVLKGMIVLIGVMFLYGCTTMKNVEVRRYTEVKDRVDQNMEGGNAGTIFGEPQPEDRSAIRKTRKTYVLEVSTNIPEGEAQVREEAVDESELIFETEEDLGWEDEEMNEGMIFSTSPIADFTPAGPVQYTVQKDDTLQKISKKFYDSHSQWAKIYEFNKSVISNPDSIKPGIVIQIPMK